MISEICRINVDSPSTGSTLIGNFEEGNTKNEPKMVDEMPSKTNVCITKHITKH